MVSGSFSSSAWTDSENADRVMKMTNYLQLQFHHHSPSSKVLNPHLLIDRLSSCLRGRRTVASFKITRTTKPTKEHKKSFPGAYLGKYYRYIVTSVCSSKRSKNLVNY